MPEQSTRNQQRRQDRRYRVLTYGRRNSPPRAGLLYDGRIFDAADLVEQSGLAAPQRFTSVLTMLAHWDWAQATLSTALSWALSNEVRTATLSLPYAISDPYPPIVYPGTLYIAVRQWTHCAKPTRAPRNSHEQLEPNDPASTLRHFVMPARACIAGPGEYIRLPSNVENVSYEARLAVIVGRQTRNIGPDAALRNIAGYTLAHVLWPEFDEPLKARGDRLDDPYDGTVQSGIDKSCLMGPAIRLEKEVSDPARLNYRVHVNGIVRSEASIATEFGIASEVAFLSQSVTLYPGDVILADNCPPPEASKIAAHLHRGDIVSCTLEDIGTLEYALRA